MTVSDLLNSDMKTIVGEVRRGFAWWVDELRSLVPRRMREWSTTKTPTIFFGAQEDLAATSVEFRTSPIILISERAVLRRDVTTPAMSRGDFAQMLALNSERYFPVPGAALILAQATGVAAADNGMMQIGVAALPLGHAQALAGALKATRITPRAICIGDRNLNADLRFNFLPGMRAAGLIPPPSRSRALWWTVVAAFALLNLMALILRDAAENDRLRALVEAQRPALAVAQKMTSQMRAFNTVAQEAAAKRTQSEPLALLAETTLALPDGAWVQRFAWDGEALRLTGYRARDGDVVAALRRSTRFVSVKSAQTDSMGETLTGQPFDLTAEVRRR